MKTIITVAVEYGDLMDLITEKDIEEVFYEAGDIDWRVSVLSVEHDDRAVGGES